MLIGQTADWILRLAHEDDISALEALIPISVHALQTQFYTQEQREAAIGPVFSVDRQLIQDGTYFVVEANTTIVACGGWSKRAALFGGDSASQEAPLLLHPEHDAARVRAFFVHPHWTRQGIGRALLSVCESALRAAGFTRTQLVATLAGEPLYSAAGYHVDRRYEILLRDNITLPVVHMSKAFSPLNIDIRQAKASDVETVHSILVEAATWLEEQGMPLWRVDELQIEHIACDVEQSQFYIAKVDDIAAGVFKFQLEDQLFWPDVKPDESAFVHRVAVRRCFAGGAVSTAMLNWAAQKARAIGLRYLRLDCDAARPKLRAVYERFGFRHHSDRQVGPYFVARYELPLND